RGTLRDDIHHFDPLDHRREPVGVRRHGAVGVAEWSRLQHLGSDRLDPGPHLGQPAIGPERGRDHDEFAHLLRVARRDCHAPGDTPPGRTGGRIRRSLRTYTGWRVVTATPIAPPRL